MNEQNGKEKPKQIVHEAIYGTSFHGKYCWFCYAPYCTQVIVTLTEEREEYALEEESFFIRPDGWQRLTDGSYGRHKRAQFRSPDARESGVVIKHAEQEAMYGDRGSQEILDVTRQESEAAVSRDKGKGLISSLELPIVIECPSCHLKNIVPRYRGPIDIHKGVRLK